MKKIILLLCILFANVTLSQIGDLDPNFFVNNNGASKGFNNRVTQVIRQSDGKLLCIGDFTKYGTTDANKIIRLNQDGSVDTAFSIPNFSTSNIDAIALQADGKILVGGDFSMVDGSNVSQLVRLNANGTRDTSFSSPLQGSGYRVMAITILNDGRIAIGGNLLYANTMAKVAILSNTGTIDTSFTPISLDNHVYKIVESTDGKLYIGGYFTGGIVKLNLDGTKDTTFDIGSSTGCSSGNQCIIDFKIQADGKVVIVGSFSTFNGEARKNIVRLLATGAVDTTFTTNGTGFNNIIKNVIINSDNTFYVTGDFTMNNGVSMERIAKLNSNGALNTSFTNPKATGGVLGIIPYNNKLLVYGQFTGIGSINAARLAILNNDGTKDNSFEMPANGLDGVVVKILKQNDGKLVLFGNFNYLDNNKAIRIVRMNANGTYDSTFNSGSGFNSNIINAVIDVNGKIIVVGNFTEYNGAPVSRIVRLNSNGTLDTSFSPNVNGLIEALDTDSNAKVYIGGEFTSVNGTTKLKLARLNNDGTLDTTFTGYNPGSTIGVGDNAASYIKVIKVLESGDVLIGGLLPNYHSIVKLNTNGAKVANSNSGFYDVKVEGGHVSAIDTHEDGKIVIGGTFTVVSQLPKKKLVRLSANGTIDNNFILGGGFTDGEVKAIAIQQDGSVLVGGSFSTLNTGSFTHPNTYTNVSVNGLVLLSNSNGVITNNFSPIFLNSGAIVYDLLPDNGFVYIGGNFSTYNSTPKNYLVKALVSVPAPKADSNQNLCPNSKVSDLVAEGENIQWFDRAAGGTALQPYFSLGNNVDYHVSQTIMGIESPRKRVRVYTTGIPAPTGNATQFVAIGSKLYDLVINGSNIKWYGTENDAASKTNPIPASTVVNFDTTYYATQTIGNCESATHIAILVKDLNLNLSNVKKNVAIIYPNPANDVLHFNNLNNVEKVTIYNAIGTKVFELMKPTMNRINISKLAKGNYIIVIETDKIKESKKFIKQ